MSDAQERPGPLHGILVADFSRVLAGPLATMTLGDLGADVVKVERPGTGDETRSWAPPYAPDGSSTYYLAVNRNKRGVTLDLSTPDGRTTARALALRADVLVENPRLVYASITGFGRGAGAKLPGYDFLIQAVGGLMSITGQPDGAATKVGVALVGVLAALYARERTGRGQRVDVDLLSSLLAGLVNQASAYLNGGVVPGRLGNRHPSIAPYETLGTADRPIAIAVGNDGQFGHLCQALTAVGGEAVARLPADPRFADNPSRVRHRGALISALEEILGTRPAAHWIATLSAAGVPCGAVNDIDEAFALADSLGLEPAVFQGPVRSVASPLHLSDTPVSYRRPPPALGQHNREI